MKIFMKKVCRFISRVVTVLIAFYLLAGVAFSSSPSFTFVNADTGTGSRLYFDNIKPGETVYGSFQISLLEDVPALFEIMFNDKASFKLKKLAYDEVKEDSFFFSKWFKYDVSSPVFVDGLGSVDIPFSIHVPDDAIPGDYSGLFVSALKTYGLEALKANEIITSGLEEESSITGARINVGVAIEVLLRVAGEIFPSVEFVDVGYYKDKGSDKFVLDLFYKNTGNVAVVPRANVKILDVWGNELYSGTFRFSVLNALMDGNSKIKINSKDFELTSGIYSLKVDLFYDVFSRDLGENLVYVSGTADPTLFPYTTLSDLFRVLLK